MSKTDSDNPNEIFPKGAPAPKNYFTGNAWVRPLVGDADNLHCTVGNVVFEPGARNFWHTHPAGQVLLVTDGTGYYQEKGKPIQSLRKGDVVSIPANVEHWHGASPDSWFTHIAINPNTQNGVVTWLRAVTDEEYHAV